MTVKIITCVVCSIDEGVKYKCPTCRAAYCSMKCCKDHKLNTCSNNVDVESCEIYGASSANASASRLKYRYETDDTVALEQLERLTENIKLKRALENPHLRRMMEAVDRSTDAAHALSEAMKEPIFTEMADECLKTIEGRYLSDSEDDD